MVTLLGLVLLGLSKAGGDGQDAVEAARTFARRVGYKGKLNLSSLTALSESDSERWGFGRRKSQQVTFTLSKGSWMTIYLNPNNEVQLFQVVNPALQQSRGLQPTTQKSAGDMAKALIKVIGAKGDFQMRTIQVGQSDPFAMVYFDMLVANHKFFNLNPTYGYRLDFNTKTGEATYFSRPPRIPPVTAKQPQISSAKAMSLLEHWAKTHYKSGGGVAYLYGPTWRGKPHLQPELGYFKFANESKARLVWQAHVWMQFNPGTPTMESGLLRMYADAVTGELIAPDDNGIN